MNFEHTRVPIRLDYMLKQMWQDLDTNVEEESMWAPNRERESSLWPLPTFCMSTPILKFEMTVFVICKSLLNKDDPNLFQQPKLFMELEVPITGSQ